MSKPRPPVPVKLVASIFSPKEEIIEEALGIMAKAFGEIDWVSPLIPFDRTRYYEREMGWPLVRRFVSFLELISPESLPDIKLRTNEMEIHLSPGPNRRVNIDPGYIALERLVLATGKNYTHRIYLAKGIYADLTLIFHKKGFRPLSWTYPDYREETIVSYFNQIRARYLNQLRGGSIA